MTENTNLLQETSVNVKPEGMPDKFWDTDKGEVRLDALMKSYLELEKKMSTANPSGSLLSIPTSAEEYQIAVKDNLFEPDIELNRRLHAKGFAPEQVQEVYDLAVEKMVPMILDMAAEFQAEREIERLTAHFGGEDQWREVSRQMLSFGKKNLPPQVLQGMSASYEGIMALYKMMQSEEPMTLGAKAKSIATNAEKDLQSMMNDPKYWRDKDPSYIAKVTEGFKNLYAE